MPFNEDALTQRDKLTAKEIPHLDRDEFVEILSARDFSRESPLEAAAMRRMPPLPLEGETEDETAARPPELRRDDFIFWCSVADYMIARLHVRDKHGAWMDADATQPAGTREQRAKIMRVWGPYFVMEFTKRYGGIIRVPEGKVNANGDPLSDGHDLLRADGALPGTDDPGGAGGGRALPDPQDGAGRHAARSGAAGAAHAGVRA